MLGLFPWAPYHRALVMVSMAQYRWTVGWPTPYREAPMKVKQVRTVHRLYRSYTSALVLQLDSNPKIIYLNTVVNNHVQNLTPNVWVGFISK